MATIRLLLHGRRFLSNPTSRLNRDFNRYLEITRSVGGAYDSILGCQKFPMDRLPDAIRALTVAGFEVEVEEALREHLERAKVEQTKHAEEAKSLHDAALARMNLIDIDLAKRGLALYPYQRDGVRWMSHRRGAGLFDEMGLGKTVQALIAAPEGAAILVVAPAAVKGVWMREARRWRPDLGWPMVLAGRSSFRWPKPGEMLITNYDILPQPEAINPDLPNTRYRLPEWLPAPATKTLIIYDECHALKSPRAKRTISARLLSKAVREKDGFCWGLTGTPLLNRPKELWHVLRVLNVAEEAYGSWRDFRAMFDWVTEKPRPEVAERLRKVSLMRRRIEVLPDLPTKTYQDVKVPIDDDTRRLADLMVQKLKDAGVDLNRIESVADLVSSTKRARLTLGEISRVRAALAEAKIPMLLDIVREYEAEDKPVVVFSSHRRPIETLAKREGWVMVTGEVTGLDRTNIVEQFSKGKMKGIACTIRAAGVGIDGLQRAAHEAIFCDLDWTPGWNQQAEDRICRIGQDRGVIITTMIADHMMDEKVTMLLAKKTRIIDEAVNASARDEVEEQFAAAAETDELLSTVKVKSKEEIAAEEKKRHAAHVIPIPTLSEMFDKVKATGLEAPRIRLDGFELKVAGRYSKYCGQVLVTNGIGYGQPGNEWYGRIVDGNFVAGSGCPARVVETIKLWDAEPKTLAADAAAYGHHTGICCFCGLELTDERSVTAGYGPICADRWGLAWGLAVDQTEPINLKDLMERP